MQPSRAGRVIWRIVVALLLALGIVIAIWPQQVADGIVPNLAAQIVGMVATLLLVNLLLTRHEKRQEEERSAAEKRKIELERERAQSFLSHILLVPMNRILWHVIRVDDRAKEDIHDAHRILRGVKEELLEQADELRDYCLMYSTVLPNEVIMPLQAIQRRARGVARVADNPNAAVVAHEVNSDYLFMLSMFRVARRSDLVREAWIEMRRFWVELLEEDVGKATAERMLAIMMSDADQEADAQSD